MSDIVIRVENLSKKYVIGHSKGGSSGDGLRHAVQDAIAAPWRALQKSRKRKAESGNGESSTDFSSQLSTFNSSTEEFYALRDVSFEVKRGEVLGIIGRNGAGKSTLLKILSRITDPTSGRIGIKGRVASLLEVGTGFHPELTGRENIYLNGAILGMSRVEIKRKFDEIVAFAEVEKFLDTPVKRFSSGMYVRLAFAVAAHLEPEILIVDEVLAVGDTGFQKKCLGKMKDVATGGRTVLFVSHHMQSVSVLCTKAMFLEKGCVTYFGHVSGGIDRYARSFENSLRNDSDPQYRSGTGELRFMTVTAGKDFYACGAVKALRYSIRRIKPFTGKFFVSCHIVNDLGLTIVQCDSRLVDHWHDIVDRTDGELQIRTPWFKPGTYRVDFFICSAGVIDSFEHACTINVIPLLPFPAAGSTEATATGLVFADFTYAASNNLFSNADAQIAVVADT